MKFHELKLDIKYCDDVLCRRKNFEIRYNDRNYKVGDKIKFTAIKDGVKIEHEINKYKYTIMYILDGFEGLRDGYIAFVIAEHWIDL